MKRDRGAAILLAMLIAAPGLALWLPRVLGM